METIFGLIISIVCGLICVKLADGKGRTKLWFLAGFFLNLLGIIIIFLMSDLYNSKIHETQDDDISAQNRKIRLLKDVKTDDTSTTLLCDQCSMFNKMTQICKEYKTDIDMKITECPNFTEPIT
jgi:hypothetical protein